MIWRKKTSSSPQADSPHRYGHCWRCKTPIIFIAHKPVVLRISDLRDRMLGEVSRITWYPDWAGSASFADWISTMPATGAYPGRGTGEFPCPSGAVRLADASMSSAHLRSWNREAAKARGSAPAGCRQGPPGPPRGGKMVRSPDVFDVWFDSAVASWATLRFPSHKEEFAEWWPADFITEGHDQTRCGLDSQMGASMVSFGRAPYKSVLMHGSPWIDQGRKMSRA